MVTDAIYGWVKSLLAWEKAGGVRKGNGPLGGSNRTASPCSNHTVGRVKAIIYCRYRPGKKHA